MLNKPMSLLNAAVDFKSNKTDICTLKDKMSALANGHHQNIYSYLPQKFFCTY